MSERMSARKRLAEAMFAGGVVTALALAVVVGAVRQWSYAVVLPLALWAAYHAGCFVEHVLHFLRPDALGDVMNSQEGQR